MSPISSKTIAREHAAAYTALRAAENAVAAVTVPATFIMVPEFGVTHIFEPGELDRQATKYEAAHGEQGDGFRSRIAAYREALSVLLALKEQWREQSGLNGLEVAEREARYEEQLAWSRLLARLQSGRDKAPITRYLAAEGKVLEAWRLRQAFKAMTPKAGGRQ